MRIKMKTAIAACALFLIPLPAFPDTVPESDAAALSAADSYIQNYRRGPAHVVLGGVAPGTTVHVKLRNHAFNFGTAVAGHDSEEFHYLVDRPHYTDFLTSHFNSIVTEGGGWRANESTRDVVDMSAIDAMTGYAAEHDLTLRVHPMLYGLEGQPPSWAETLLDEAAHGSISAKNELRQEISERIAYYARDYEELNVVNEFVHFPKFNEVFGASGMADIFSEVAAATPSPLYVNEYFVLQYGADDTGEWYKQAVKELLDAGAPVGGIGVEYYVGHDTGRYAHSAARIKATLDNLATLGLPITLSEFAAAPNVSETEAAQYLSETMRLVFGHPGTTTFNLWGFTPIDVWSEAPQAVLVDADWNLTPAGIAYEALMDAWNTEETLIVGADHAIDFTGFYGDYDLLIDGELVPLKLENGVTDYFVGAIPGDFNFDGRVDGEDYSLWRNTFGTTGFSEADFNHNGIVDAADYTVWRNHFGEAIGSGFAANADASVPEPATKVLLTLAGAAGVSRNKGVRSAQ